MIESVRFEFQTYLAGRAGSKLGEDDDQYGEPYVHVGAISSEGGPTVMLGGEHAYDDSGKPILHIERRPYGWTVELINTRGDVVGTLAFGDAGAVLLVNKKFDGSPPEGEEVEVVDDFPIWLDNPHPWPPNTKRE